MLRAPGFEPDVGFKFRHPIGPPRAPLELGSESDDEARYAAVGGGFVEENSEII